MGIDFIKLNDSWNSRFNLYLYDIYKRYINIELNTFYIITKSE